MISSLLGYARVSTRQQDTSSQVTKLRDHGCDHVWTELASGTRADRPELESLLGYARSEDTLVVCRLDRLGRSLSQLVATASDLDQRNIGRRSLAEQLDTTTAAGQLRHRSRRSHHPRIPKRNRVTGVRRTSRSYAPTVRTSEIATMTMYLTAIGASHSTTPYATPTTIGWCRM